MCYGGEYLYSELTDKLHWISHKDLHDLIQQHRIVENEKGRFYPRHIIPLSIYVEGAYRIVPGRFDMINRDYMSKLKDATIPDLLKFKDSRRIDPNTKRATGYPTWNARVETIGELFTFRQSWHSNRRAVIPISAFLERPNEQDTPVEFKGKEFKITLAEPAWLGCVWDYVERQGQRLYSFAIVTQDSDGHRIRKEIHHIRMPTLLTVEEAEEWVDPKVGADRAHQMVRQYPEDRMTITEEAPVPKAKPKTKPKKEDEEPRLEL